MIAVVEIHRDARRPDVDHMDVWTELRDVTGQQLRDPSLDTIAVFPGILGMLPLGSTKKDGASLLGQAEIPPDVAPHFGRDLDWRRQAIIVGAVGDRMRD